MLSSACDLGIVSLVCVRILLQHFVSVIVITRPIFILLFLWCDHSLDLHHAVFVASSWWHLGVLLALLGRSWATLGALLAVLGVLLCSHDDEHHSST